MRSSWTRKLAAPLFATSLAACGDSIGPGQGSVDYTDLALDFCNETGQFPLFFAYLNEGENWTRVNGNANRTFAFRASDKVGIAMVFFDGVDTYSTEVIYAKNEELEPLSGGACEDIPGYKTVNGAVSGVAAGDFSYVTMDLSQALVEPPPSTFSLIDVALAPRDVIAHAGSDQITGEVPDAVIIRRGISASTTNLATFDFNSNEAAAPTVNTVTITGLSASEDNLIDMYFSTFDTFDHPFFLSSFFTSGTQTIYHVPSALTLAGDLHMLDVYGQNGTAVRGETQWYRNAANRSVSFGSHLSTPTISTIASSPVVRLRAQLPVQPEYNSFAVALYQQSTTSTLRSVSVFGTAGFFDSPSNWVLDIPDLGILSGFPTASGLQSGGTQTEYDIFAYTGDLLNFFGAPAEGSSVKYAGRSSSTTTMIALRGDQSSRRSVRRAPALRVSRHKIGTR